MINIETKSRYEVISDLETNKRSLIREREALQNEVKQRELDIKNLKRTLEDKETDLKDCKDSLDGKKDTINELIESVEASLQRLSTMQTK